MSRPALVSLVLLALSPLASGDDARPKAARVVEERADADAFPPLPKTKPGDWLAVHPEPGQTFEQFRGSRRRPVTEERRTLYVAVLDDTTRIGVRPQVLVDHLAAYFGVPAAVAHPDPEPAFTTRRDRRQTLTTDVLRWMPDQMPSDGYALLAVTTRDLYAGNDWNFVFGEAAPLARVGVFSFARMDPAFPAPPPDPAGRDGATRALVLRRCLKVVTHEIGHLFGLEHCVAGLCLMNGANGVDEMDRTPLHLCPECLRKVAHACDLDLVERYRRLETAYAAAGLDAEREFVSKRVTRLTEKPIPTAR